MDGDPTPDGADAVETLGDGRYVLGAVVGTGGMGVVRRATDTLLHREVAVKLLANHLAAEPEARERFLHEGRSMARVSNPHVVAVHDVGEDGGRPYLVLELVDGPSLADELQRRGRLDGDDVEGIAAQTLVGLAAAHSAGVLHRDVKPGNLLRTPGDDIKVVDFGVAQAADTPGLTRTGHVIGTRSYLAPERRRGTPASVATDLYALGATLVELVSGRPPDADADPLAGLPDDVSANLRHLMATLLAAAPADRPASAEDALVTLAEGRPGTDATAAVEADRPPPPAAEASDAPAATDAGTQAAATDRRERFIEHGWRVVLLVGLALIAIGVLLRLN